MTYGLKKGSGNTTKIMANGMEFKHNSIVGMSLIENITLELEKHDGISTIGMSAYEDGCNSGRHELAQEILNIIKSK